MEKTVKISLDSKTSSIIDFNNEFYCLIDKYKILLLNKENLVTARKIEINTYMNSSNLGIIKLSDKLISVFAYKYEKFEVNNYDILSNGIKWKYKQNKTLLEKKIHDFHRNNNFILVKKEKEIQYKSRKNVYYESYNVYYLYEVKIKKGN